jgi:hypothetical protein
MVFVTKLLTIGQLTFVLRVLIQALSLAGPLLIGLIIMSNAPRLASFTTHDMLNRIRGKLSVTRSSVIWLWNHTRGKNRDPGRSPPLVISVTLLVLYNLFISLGDLGFLGLYTCDVPIAAHYEPIGSVPNEDVARSLVLSNFLNGSNAESIRAVRCDSSYLYRVLDDNSTIYDCAALRNSTWLDRNLFTGINSTDSDMLIPRKIGRYNRTNSFYAQVGGKKIQAPTIKNGILVNPIDTGFQAIFGVPNISRDQEFKIDKTMALEVEVGCMALGIDAAKEAGDLSLDSKDIFRTNVTWRKYSGPEILHDVLFNWTDAIREHSLPLFNASSTLAPDGALWSINASQARFGDITYITETSVPINVTRGFGEPDRLLEGCTNSIRQKLGLTALEFEENESFSCATIGISGSISADGQFVQGQSRFLCASAPQINMVSATIRTDPQGSIYVDITRLPSDLYESRTDFWEVVRVEENNAYYMEEPLFRYTLSDNTDGLTSHYIKQSLSDDWSIRLPGPGSSGSILRRVGSRIISPRSELTRKSIQTIRETGRTSFFDPKMVTRWTGQVGASMILASLQYNPWVALEAPPVLVISHSGKIAICYHPLYAISFVPLASTALVVLIWFLFTLVRTSWRRLKLLGKIYGGIYSYFKSITAEIQLQSALLIWKRQPNPHLHIYISEDNLPIEIDALHAAEYLEREKERC